MWGGAWGGLLWLGGLGWVLSEVCLSLDGEGLKKDEGMEVLREILFG